MRSHQIRKVAVVTNFGGYGVYQALDESTLLNFIVLFQSYYYFSPARVFFQVPYSLRSLT